jgi:hypothetical protein
VSSNRHAQPCEAYLQREGDEVGPLRLPLKDPVRFINQFNRVYARLGLKILPAGEATGKEQGRPTQ